MSVRGSLCHEFLDKCVEYGSLGFEFVTPLMDSQSVSLFPTVLGLASGTANTVDRASQVESAPEIEQVSVPANARGDQDSVDSTCGVVGSRVEGLNAVSEAPVTPSSDAIVGAMSHVSTCLPPAVSLSDYV